MKRDREVDDGVPNEREPGWVNALIVLADKGPKHTNPFQDDSLEWDRWCYSSRLFGSYHKNGDRMLPLGFMIKEWMWPCVDTYVCTFNIDIRDPCVWIDNIPYTPVEWAMRLGVLCDIWVEIFWRVGVRAADIPCQIHEDRGEDYMCRLQIINCGQMEDGIMAMVWCCKQVTETSWHDNATIIAERMRRVKCADWVEVRNELDYQKCLLDGDFV